MDKGWAKLPILLKIVFVILLFRCSLSLFSLTQIYQDGYEFFGLTLYGTLAVNADFVLSIAFPVVILFGMYQRYPKIWIIAIVYFVIYSLNAVLTIPKSEEILLRISAYLPERSSLVHEDISEQMYHDILVYTIASSYIFSALFNITLLIFFIVKRKYFIEYKGNITKNEELSS